jgi:hypothetical protein
LCTRTRAHVVCVCACLTVCECVCVRVPPRRARPRGPPVALARTALAPAAGPLQPPKPLRPARARRYSPFAPRLEEGEEPVQAPPRRALFEVNPASRQQGHGLWGCARVCKGERFSKGCRSKRDHPPGARARAASNGPAARAASSEPRRFAPAPPPRPPLADRVERAGRAPPPLHCPPPTHHADSEEIVGRVQAPRRLGVVVAVADQGVEQVKHGPLGGKGGRCNRKGVVGSVNGEAGWVGVVRVFCTSRRERPRLLHTGTQRAAPFPLPPQPLNPSTHRSTLPALDPNKTPRPDP